MRPLKRVLLFATEIGVFIVGFVLSTALGISVESNLSSAAFFAGVLITVAGFFAFRKRTLRWKIEYDAEAFRRNKNASKLHPARARFKRSAQRILVCSPALIAALVLFFFPIASHLIHPTSRYLRHFSVPIPWNFTVLSSQDLGFGEVFVEALGKTSDAARFGFTPFGDEKPFSLMSFGANHAEPGERISEPIEDRTSVLQRTFQLGDGALTCRQQQPPPLRRCCISGPFRLKVFTGRFWQIDCTAPANVHRQSFFASFAGREEDVPAFYKIIEGVAVVE